MGTVANGQRGVTGTLSHADFMARCWQRRAHLVRQALAVAPLSPAQLRELAARDDVESRVVVHEGGEWILEQGPFPRRFWRNLPATHWTLLVQGVDHVVPECARVLSQFSFLPRARLDDVMVSHAVRDGGVGPHFDSYDVFLLQASGRRRWRISAQRDLALVEGAPLRILARFRPTCEWTLDPGDMLYLPPRIAHDGVALDDACTTWSIGFRAPRWRELLGELFADLPAGGIADRLYGDAGARPTTQPGAIPETMIDGLADALSRVRFSRADLADVIGRTLATPKPTVIFARPLHPLTLAGWRRRARSQGIALDPRSIVLFHEHTLFVNGDAMQPPAALRQALQQLANTRSLRDVPAPLATWLYDWYCAGWLHLR